MSGESKQQRMAYEQLRRLLVHSQLPPGTRLKETQWAERLGVCRSALREAMGLLAHEGLLRRGERGGFFVPELKQRDVREILEARSAIETGAVRLSADAEPDPEALDRLDELCDQMQQMIERGYVMGVEEADRKFHQALVELCGNTRLIRLYDHAPLPFGLADLLGVRRRKDAGLRTVSEHRQIAQMIRQGSFSEAIELLETHLARMPRVALSE